MSAPLHVAITGASAGIGEALVREFRAAGAVVTLVARRHDLLEKLAREPGGRTFLVATDLSKIETACDWLEPSQRELGPIDVLINNAGVQFVEPAEEMDLARGRMLLDLDLWVPMALTRALLPAMVARRSGTIVDVSSMAGIAPTPGMWFYNAAKGGLAAASESLRGELRRTGVHVVTVYPGPVDTAMGRAGYAAYPSSLATRALPAGTADVLARRVRRAVERRRARVIYPWFYTLSRHFPALTRFFLDRFTPRARSLLSDGKS